MEKIENNIKVIEFINSYNSKVISDKIIDEAGGFINIPTNEFKDLPEQNEFCITIKKVRYGHYCNDKRVDSIELDREDLKYLHDKYIKVYDKAKRKENERAKELVQSDIFTLREKLKFAEDDLYKLNKKYGDKRI